MTIFVIAEDGTKLMPTSNIKKVRRFLRSGRAVICKHEPFTIKLCYKSTKHTLRLKTISLMVSYMDLVLYLKH